jgi:hypothetical protein
VAHKLSQAASRHCGTRGLGLYLSEPPEHAANQLVSAAQAGDSETLRALADAIAAEPHLASPVLAILAREAATAGRHSGSPFG